MLQATFLVAVTYTLFYTLATWSLAWGTKEQGEGGGNLGFTNQEYLLMLMISICVFALFIVLSCLYADKIGRRRVLTFSSCALVVFAVLFPFPAGRWSGRPGRTSSPTWCSCASALP